MISQYRVTCSLDLLFQETTKILLAKRRKLKYIIIISRNCPNIMYEIENYLLMSPLNFTRNPECAVFSSENKG